MVILFLLWFLNLFANQATHVNPHVLAVTEGEPHLHICDSVNPLTGDFYISRNEIVIEGAQPLPIPILYISGDGQTDYKGKVGFEILPHLKLVHFVDDRRVARVDRVIVAEKNGSRLSFDRALENEYLMDFKKHGDGITNDARGEIGGRTHLQNYRVLKTNPREMVVYTADGTERIYQFKHVVKEIGESWELFLLESEKLSNGNRIYYSYHSNGKIKLIKTTNPDGTKIYAWARFNYEGDADVTIKTSDNRTVTFHFKPYVYEEYDKDGDSRKRPVDCFILDKIERNFGPTETFHFEDGHKGDGPRIRKMSLPLKCSIVPSYFKNKVKTLSGPLGMTHKFTYKSGEAEILDAEDNKISIKANKECRPLETNWYIGKDQLYCSEKNFWTESGNLKAKLFTDGKNVSFAKIYDYDVFGNVLTEKLCGNLSGLARSHFKITYDKTPSKFYEAYVYENDIHRVLLCDDGKASKCKELRREGPGLYIPRSEPESFWKLNQVKGALAKFQILHEDSILTDADEIAETTYGYYPNHLMAWKKEPSGLITRFTYLEDTDLLTSRLTYDGDKILIREYFEYQDYLLISEIKDNGITADPRNLLGATHRFIKKITPRRSEHFYGLPELVEEKYTVMATGEEKLLRKTILAYTSQGKVKKQEIYDSDDNHRYTLSKKYDKQGYLTSETNPIGEIRTYTYDAVGNVLSAEEKRLTTFYTYDHANRLIETREKGDDGTQRTTHHHYNLKNQKIGSIDPQGNKTEYTYDPFDHLIQTKLPTSETVSATYDGLGRQTSSTNARGEKTTQTFNIRGKPTFISYADGTQEKFIYNLEGTLKTSIDQLGTSTDYTYDVLGRVTCKTISNGDTILSSESWTYNAFHLLSKTDAAGHVTTYEYDCAGRKIAENCMGDRIEYQYDTLGRLTHTQGSNRTVGRDFDLLGRVTEERIEDLTRVSYKYDAAGNKSEIIRYTENGPAIELTLYDPYKRPIERVDGLGQITRFIYDDKESKKTTIDPAGIQRIETFDPLGRPIALEILNTFHELIHKETYLYDADGNKISQTSKTITTKWKYGSQKRVLKLIEAAGTPEQKITRYTYTVKGMLHQVHKPDGIILTYTYDPLNRLHELTSSDQSCHLRYTYNGLHQPELIEDLVQGTQVRRSYDHHSRLISETLANGLTISSSYDSLGRKTALFLPDQSSILYTYDAAFLRKITRISPHQKELYHHAYTHFNQSGQLLEQKLIKNLGSQKFKTDLLGRTISTSCPYFEASLHYDPQGNLQTVVQDGQTSNYSYDDLSQLTGEPHHAYVYDSHHNRILKDGSSSIFNHLNQDGHLKYDRNGNLLSDGTLQFTYDVFDRITTITSPTHHAIFTYDPFHRRISKKLFIKGACTKCSFLYDGDQEIGSVGSNQLLELRILGLGKGAEIGAAVALELRGELFLPIHDLRGNVIKLISAKTRKVVETTTYTAFGEETISNPINPWRFSSKRTDTEFNLVYYGRRFYSPSLGRWLTPDPQGFTDGMNLYAFVHNNPLLKLDLHGLFGYNFQFSVPVSDCIQGLGYGLAALGNCLTFLDGGSTASLGRWMMGKTVEKRDHSQFIRHGSRDAGNHVRITAVNGILNCFADASLLTALISEAHGGALVNFLYNATHGFFSDIAETILDLTGIGSRPARLLAHEWRSMIQEFQGNNISDGVIYHYAHSQGGAITESALKLLTPEERQYINVVTFGSASLFSSELAASVLHYVSIRDGVPMTNILGYIKAIFCKIFGLSSNVQFIGSPCGPPLVEHGFQNSTYWPRLLQRGDEFQNTYFYEK